MLLTYTTHTQIIHNPTNFTKITTFINNETKQHTSIPFPPINYPTIHPSNDITELANKFIQYLTDIGIIRNNYMDLQKGHKLYNCQISFDISYHEEPFKILLKLIYQINKFDQDKEKLPANLYVSNEELINYLRDKIVLNNVKTLSGIESKINILLRLCSIRIYINGEEVNCK